VTNICFFPTLYCHKERQFRFSRKSHHTTFNKTCHMCTSQTPNLLRTTRIPSSFFCRNFRLRGSINFTMREQLLFYRLVNWPADGNTYYTKKLQTSLSCEILRLYPRSSTYVYRICTLFKADELNGNNRNRPDRTISLRNSNPEYILLLKCHYNVVVVFRICMRTLRRVISCCSGRTNASLCRKL
jgi:hypothetical protein